MRFKTGDRVRIIKFEKDVSGYEPQYIINKTGEVTGIVDEKYPYNVKIDGDLEITLLFAEDELETEEPCQYCTQLKSLYFSEDHDNIREVYIELDGSISISHWCQDEMGGVNFEISYCPKCGRKLA